MYYHQALTHLKLNDRVEAIKSLNLAINIDPNHAEAYYQRGKLRSGTRAVADFSKAIELRPDWADAYYLRAQDYPKGEKGEAFIDKRETDLSKAIELDPDNLEYLKYRARFYSGIKNFGWTG